MDFSVVRKISDEVTLQLPDHDFDVRLRLPNGEEVEVQWRIENPSMDIILDENRTVVNYKGDELEPAPKVKNCPAYVRHAKQLTIGFSPDALVAKP